MLEAIIKHNLIFYVMGIAVAVGIFAKVISYITAGKMVKAASEIQKSNHRLMKLVKAKFEHASMVSDKVQNVDAFVKKYLYEYKVLGVRFYTWRACQMKIIWLVAALGILGILGSYKLYGMGEMVFQYAAWTSVFAVLLFSIHILGEEKAKLSATRNYMVDYLENVCIRRYEKTNQITSEQEAGAKVEKAEVKQEDKPEIKEEAELLKERSDQEMRIRAILEEFLA